MASVTLTQVVNAVRASSEILKDMPKSNGHRLRSVREECRMGAYRGVQLSSPEEEVAFDESLEELF